MLLNTMCNLIYSLGKNRDFPYLSNFLFSSSSLEPESWNSVTSMDRPRARPRARTTPQPGTAHSQVKSSRAKRGLVTSLTAISGFAARRYCPDWQTADTIAFCLFDNGPPDVARFKFPNIPTTKVLFTGRTTTTALRLAAQGWGLWLVFDEVAAAAAKVRCHCDRKGHDAVLGLGKAAALRARRAGGSAGALRFAGAAGDGIGGGSVAGV